MINVKIKKAGTVSCDGCSQNRQNVKIFEFKHVSIKLCAFCRIDLENKLKKEQ